MWVLTLVIGVLVRVGVLLFFREGSALGDGVTLPVGDQHEYLGLAQSLLDGNGFSLAVAGAEPGEPYLYRPPLYPVFLAASLWLTGGSLAGVRVIQFSLTLLHLPLFLLLARHFALSPALRSMGALLVVTSPFLAYFALFLNADWLFQLTIVAAVALLLGARRAGRTGGMACAGVMFGVSAMVRGEGWYLGWGMAALHLLLTRDRRGVRHAGALALGLLLVVAPWGVRNWSHTGRWIPVQEGTIENATIASYRPVWSGVPWSGYEEWERELRAVELTLPEGERPGYLRREMLSFYGANPTTFAWATLVKAGHLWALWPSASFYGDPTQRTEYQGVGYRLLSLGGFGLLLPTFLLGLAGLARARNPEFLLLLALFALNLGMGVLANPDIRIRSQLHLLILTLALLPLEALWQRRSR